MTPDELLDTVRAARSASNQAHEEFLQKATALRADLRRFADDLEAEAAAQSPAVVDGMLKRLEDNGDR